MSTNKIQGKSQEQSVELRKQDETRETRKKEQKPESANPSQVAAAPKEYNQDWQKFSQTKEEVAAPSVQKHDQKKRSEDEQGATMSAAELLRQHQQKNNGIPG